MVADGGAVLSIVLAGHPKLRNALLGPNMEEIGSRFAVFPFEGMAGHQADYIAWLLERCRAENAEPATIVEPAAVDLLAARYIRDPGILHSLLGAESFQTLESHPKLGASWEGFVIEQVLNVAGTRDTYYWGTQSGAELDLLVTVTGKRIGVEVKYADAPRMTRSMRIALEDLHLSHLYVVHPGSARYDLGGRAEAIGLAELLTEIVTAQKVRKHRPIKPERP